MLLAIGLHVFAGVLPDLLLRWRLSRNTVGPMEVQ